MRKLFFLVVLLFFSSALLADNINFNDKNGTIKIGPQEYNLNETSFLLTPEKYDSPYIFNDALKAIEAINNSEASKITLFVAPYVYWLDDPDDPQVRYPAAYTGSTPFATEISCDSLSIIGLTENPEDVVFAVNRGQTQGALGNYTMLHFKGKSLQAENMTFGNYCNIDLDYPLDSSLNRGRRNDAIVQAQLGICKGTDRLFARNCRFLSRLNLCPLVGARRSLYKDCYFECTDDALTGSAVYLDCKFTFYSGKPFYSTSKTGAVFLNCDINSLVDGTQYLTKMPGMVTLIDTRFTGDPSMMLQWTTNSSPIRCYQSNVTFNGKLVKIDADRPELGNDITGLPVLNAYKIENKDNIIYNTPNLLGGDDGWDPLGVLPEIKELEKKTGQRLTGTPVALALESSSKKLESIGDTLSLTASPRLWGDYPSKNDPTLNFSWDFPPTVNLEAKQNKAVAISANQSPHEFKGIISVTSSDGLVGATELNIDPLLKDAPSFIEKPSLSLNNSDIKLSYALSHDINDESYIIWYRFETPDGANAIPVRHGHGKNFTTYKLSSADHGYYLSASVFPKLSDTHQGQPLEALLNEKIDINLINPSLDKELNLNTSFEEIPIVNGQLGKPGFWNFDAYKPADTTDYDWEADENLSWYYGRATDASTGIGLVQATRGARLSYTPTFSGCETMKISLVAEPCKGPGQGFGSATGQYMDICIKFDPVTLNGYALRIERKPDYDKAVTFSLVHYNNGSVTSITEPVASNCFRTPCHISLEINPDSFTASAYSEAPYIMSNNPDVKPTVSLSAPVSVPTTNSSFAIQHTGTVGGSATLLRDLNVIWE